MQMHVKDKKESKISNFTRKTKTVQMHRTSIASQQTFGVRSESDWTQNSKSDCTLLFLLNIIYLY